MIKALMPVNADLESSIALRYAQALSNRIKLVIHDIHVVESDQVGPPPGSGWVRRTWENALIENASREIRHFLAMEKLKLQRLGDSEIVIGRRTDTLLESLFRLNYQLFIEGAFPTFNLSNFYDLIHSRLYRAMPCPALVVKNLVEPDSVALLIEDREYANLVRAFVQIFSGSGIGVDLLAYELSESGGLTVSDADGHPAITAAEKMLADQGLALNARTLVQGPAKEVAEHLKAYGLVAAGLPQNPRRQDPKLELLARLATPVLICWSKA